MEKFYLKENQSFSIDEYIIEWFQDIESYSLIIMGKSLS